MSDLGAHPDCWRGAVALKARIQCLLCGPIESNKVQRRQWVGQCSRSSSSMTALPLIEALRAHRATVSLEGNIGAGKSVVGRILHGRGLVTHNEPVESWNVLPLYYADPARYAYALQTQIIASYAGVGTRDEYAIMERGPRAATGVFARMLHEDGLLSNEQVQALRALHDTLPVRHPTVIVYMHVPPALCLERIARRGRESEESISPAYLDRVDQAYERFVAEAIAEGVAVLRIDASAFEGRPAALADVVAERLLAHFSQA
jgi:deoxyadenosine/deoxycytidine kinase